LNKCPTKKLKEKVPKDIWTGRKPIVSHLRIFGSLFFKHGPGQRRRNLEDKNQPIKHKERLVVKGFLQRASLDHSKVFAPMARVETIRLVVVQEAGPFFNLM